MVNSRSLEMCLIKRESSVAHEHVTFIIMDTLIWNRFYPLHSFESLADSQSFVVFRKWLEWDFCFKSKDKQK